MRIYEVGEMQTFLIVKHVVHVGTRSFLLVQAKCKNCSGVSGRLWSSLFSIFKRVRKIAKTDYYLSRSSVSPSVCIEQLGSHWTDFDEIVRFETFSKTCREN